RVRTDQVVEGHAGDGEHGLSVESSVVEAVEQVDAAWTGGGEADAELAGELRVAAGHQGGRFLVPDLHEADLVVSDAQRLHDAVDAVAGQPEDHVDAPVVDRVDQYTGCGICHGALLSHSRSFQIRRSRAQAQRASGLANTMRRPRRRPRRAAASV